MRHLKTRQSFPPPPAPCPALLFLTEPDAAGRWFTGWGTQSSWPSSSSHLSCTITSHSNHRSSCDFSLTLYFYSVFEYYYLSYNYSFSCMCFLRNCTSLRMIFIFLRSDFFPIRDWCCWYINRSSCRKGVSSVTLQYSLHFSNAFLVFINEYLYILFMSLCVRDWVF